MEDGCWNSRRRSGGAGPLAQIQMKFPDARTAVAFAERNGWLVQDHAGPSPQGTRSPDRAGDKPARDGFERWDIVDETAMDFLPIVKRKNVAGR